MIRTKRMLLISCIILCLLPQTRSNVFNAIASLEPLLKTQQRIIDNLEPYIKLSEKRLFTLKKRLNLYKNEQEKALKDISKYLENPINLFTLIRRLTTDLRFIKTGTELIKNLTFRYNDVKYPTSEDLDGAAISLDRLQDVYGLSVKDLANGTLIGNVHSTPMTATDCFELARVLFNNSCFKNALPWFRESLHKYNEEELIYTSIINNTNAEVESARAFYNQIGARGSFPYLQEIDLVKLSNRKFLEEILGGEMENGCSNHTVLHQKVYKEICRSNMQLSPSFSKNLYCGYLTQNHPFLKLAPIKMEYVYRDPDVIIFHQVLTDDEIDVIQAMAKPKLECSLIGGSGSGYFPNYRCGKTTWLFDLEPVVVAISQRVADMTGLSTDFAEHLQVVNYGIGGHFATHFDSLGKRYVRKNMLRAGDRIATVMFYMSEVAQGGATVFLRLGFGVLPIKGAALFWMNLHPSGENDPRTLHAACPVILGSKWVATKWLHESGQELLRPCKPQDRRREEQLRALPRAEQNTCT